MLNRKTIQLIGRVDYFGATPFAPRRLRPVRAVPTFTVGDVEQLVGDLFDRPLPPLPKKCEGGVFVLDTGLGSE